MRATLFTILGVLLAGISALAQNSAPDVNTIVSRMQTAMAGRNHDRAYSVTREYTLAPEDASKASRVVAEINSVPEGKSYTITQGSGQAEKVVRKVLDHETQTANDHTGAGLTIQNYDFTYMGTGAVDGHICYMLQLTPRHDGKDLVKGKVWVDAETYLVRQLSGSPVKSPSWWIKDLDVTLHYRDMDGLWLQDSTVAVAQVRLVGKHTLTERAVDVRAGTVEAAQRATHNRRRPNAALLGAGVFNNR